MCLICFVSVQSCSFTQIQQECEVFTPNMTAWATQPKTFMQETWLRPVFKDLLKHDEGPLWEDLLSGTICMTGK